MYAHYALNKLHMLPSVFVNLPLEEKAFVIASIDLKIEAEKKKQREIESKAGKKP